MNGYRKIAKLPEPVVYISEDQLWTIKTAVQEHRPKIPWENTLCLALLLAACALHPVWWDFIVIMVSSAGAGYSWNRWELDMRVWRKGMRAVAQIQNRIPEDL